jgi:hypothetical protein
MSSHATHFVFALGLGLMSAILSVEAYAHSSPTQQCEAGFEGALGKVALCRLKAEATFSKSLDATARQMALAKCSSGLATALGKVVMKFPNACPATPTTSEFDTYVATCTDGAASASDGGPLPAITPSCPAPTVEVGGACWLLGSGGQSCDDVCAAAALAYDDATATYADATLTRCGAVLNVLSVQTGIPISPLDEVACDGFGIGGIGCGQDTNIVTSHGTRCTSPATTSSASFAGARRACACK